PVVRGAGRERAFPAVPGSGGRSRHHRVARTAGGHDAAGAGRQRPPLDCRLRPAGSCQVSRPATRSRTTRERRQPAIHSSRTVALIVVALLVAGRAFAQQTRSAVLAVDTEAAVDVTVD